MTIEANPKAPVYPNGNQSAYDVELVDLSSTDYVPTNAAGQVVVARGFSFKTVGDIKITTEAGKDIVIPSGALLPGFMHGIGFKKIFKTGTGASMSLVAYI